MQPKEAPGQPDHDQDHQGPGHGRGDPPAERVHAERLLAERDQPLADVGVDDQGGGVLPQVGGLPADPCDHIPSDLVPWTIVCNLLANPRLHGPHSLASANIVIALLAILQQIA